MEMRHLGQLTCALCLFAAGAAPLALAQEGAPPGEDALPIEPTPIVETTPARPTTTPPPVIARETVCDDRQDQDGDGLADCADADCFSHPHCQAGGSEERTNDACSDWIDNDGDGTDDCDDEDCGASHITVCHGSWQGSSPQSSAGSDGGEPPSAFQSYFKSIPMNPTPRSMKRGGIRT